MALTKAHNRMIEGAAVNVKDFGAKGDGTTDDTTAIQAAIDSITTGNVYVPSGTYKITDSISIGDNKGIIGNSLNSSIIEFDYSTTGKPILDVSGLFITVKELQLKYSSLPPSTDTNAFCIAFDDFDGNTAWSTFENIYLHQCFGGIGENSSSTANIFNNVFVNVNIRNFTGWAFQIDNAANSGQTIEQLYINNNWDRGSGLVANDCLGLFEYQGGVHGVIDTINFEFANPSSSTPIILSSDNRITVNHFYLEELTYQASAPASVALGGSGSAFVINNFYMNSVTADSTQSTFDIFRISGESRVWINAATIESDCDFSGVTGDVSWLNLSSSVDPSNTRVYVFNADDQSNDIDEIIRADVQNDRPAVRQFNDRIFNYETRASISDDAAISFAPSQEQGILVVNSNNNVAYSAMIFFNVNSGGAECELIHGANATVGTSALSGTTGTDAKINLAAVTDGNIYIENRSGGTLFVYPTILAGHMQ